MHLSKRILLGLGILLGGMSSSAWAERLLLDFERNRDLNIWEIHDGNGVSLVSEGALQGQNSLLVPTDTHMSTAMLPRDWSGHSYLLVDIYNPFKTPVSIGVVIGDGEWLDRKHYWNRHNRFELIEPGHQTLKIPLAQLYRGEVDRRNIDLPNNLNLAEIVRLEIEVKGQQGSIYVDHMRLAGDGGGVAAYPDATSVAPPILQTASMPSSEKVLSDFESVRDALLWEKRTGWFDPVVVEDPKKGMGKSLKVAPDTLLSNLSLPSNWTGYGAFEFDVFVEGSKAVTLELMIGDAAWNRAQHYYNRHNGMHQLIPGQNRISVDLADLYRGEAAKRNTMLPRNIDVDAVQQVNLKFHKGEGFLYLDQFRLTGGAEGAVVTSPYQAPVRQAPVPPRPVTQPVAALPVAHAGEKLINGFESVRDVLVWEKREGWFDCELSSDHVVEGEHSMKVAAGTLLANFKMPRNWSGWDTLEFEVFNASKKILSLECMIGDDAWTRKQSYYNRHNSMHRLAPGPNTIQLDLAALYRGEVQKRNADIPSNIDLSTIVQMNLKLMGAEGFVYFDSMRFVGSGQSAPARYTPAPSVVPQPAPVRPPAAVQQGVKLLSGLEHVRDVVGWELREGWFDPAQSSEHVVEGKSSLKVAAQTLLVNNSLSANWSGYAFLEMAVHNAGARPVKLELMVGDMAWNQRQSYYNRHNSIHTLLPGENNLKISLENLYRGEPQRRNSDIARNIDLGEITQVNLRFIGKDEFLFLDKVILTNGEENIIPAPAVQAAPVKAPPAVVAKPQIKPKPVVEVEKVPPKPTVVWNGFESLRESAAFEVRQGVAELSESHVSEGKQSLRLQPSTLIATYKVPADWRGYEALEFDIFYEGEGLSKLEVMIGDQAWTQSQTYWNRFNQVFPILSGSNRISISVDDLFRGEPASRNREIARNLDLDSIVQLNLWVKEGNGYYYLDGCQLLGKLEGGGIEVADFGAPGVAAKHKRVFGFEDQREVVSWEVRHGPELKWEEQNASEGAHSLKMDSTTLIANYSFPEDWSPYEMLEFDVWLEGEGIVKMEIMIGDQAWTEKQTYWNRHNGIWPLVPGSNHVEIALDGLFRGEPASRNKDLARNIDLDQIRQVNVGYIGGSGTLFLDNFVLSAGGEEKAQVKAFDFGPEGQAVWSGFAPVSWNTVYTEATGFGFERSQPRKKNAGNANFPTRLLQDYVHVEQGDFSVDLPNGEYEVYAWFEDAGYWGGEHARFAYRSIAAEGRELVVEDRREQGVDDDALYRFLNFEPQPGKNAVREYFDSLYGPKVFVTDVQDGQLNILPWSDGPWSTRLSALVIIPHGNERSASWVKTLIEKNYKEFASRAVMLPYPKASAGLKDLAGLSIFPAHPSELLAFNEVHDASRMGGTILAAGVWGEAVPFTFGVHPTEQMGDISFKLSEWKNASGDRREAPLAMAEVRHLAKRSYEDLSYQIKPWFLRPFVSRSLEKGKTRQFWFSVPVTKDWAGGQYRAELTLLEEGAPIASLPLQLEVVPVAPDALDFPVALMGMPKEALGLLRSYGFTAISGGGGLPPPVIQEGDVTINYEALSSYLTAGQEAGLNQEAIDYGGPYYFQGMSYRHVEKYFERLGKAGGLSAVEAAEKVFEVLRQKVEAESWPQLTLNLGDEPKSLDEVKELVASARFLKSVAPHLKLSGFFSFDPENDHLGLGALWDEVDRIICKGASKSFLADALERDKSVYLYSLGRNRHTFGPVLWSHRQRGVEGYIQWHSSLIHGYQGFDLDGREPDMGLLIKHPEGYWPTLELAHIRQGLFDLRILSSLSRYQREVDGEVKGEIEALLAEVEGGVAGGVLDLDGLRVRAAKLLLKAKAY